jgi:hypothetical protein
MKKVKSFYAQPHHTGSCFHNVTKVPPCAFSVEDVVAERAAHKKEIGILKYNEKQFEKSSDKYYRELQQEVKQGAKLIKERDEAVARAKELEFFSNEVIKQCKEMNIMMQEVYGDFNGRFGKPEVGNDRIKLVMARLINLMRLAGGKNEV